MKQKKELEEMLLAKRTAKSFMPFLEKYYRAKFIGLENVPDKPFLGVGNHLGVYFLPESYLWVGKYHTLKNKPPMKVLVHHALHKMAKKLRLPQREFGILDAEPINAHNALKTGNSVTVYPGGDRENSKPFSERNTIDFYDHKGYVKLALGAQVPIVPVVGVGGGETLFVLSSGEKFAKRSGIKDRFNIHTWPVYFSLPYGLRVGHFPFLSVPLPSQITISILPPYSLEEYAPEDADNQEIVDKINADIIALMQAEMDRQVEGRIPVIGKLD